MFVRCNIQLRETKKISVFYEKAKPYLLTILYLAIFIALYLIYGSGDTHNNFNVSSTYRRI